MFRILPEEGKRLEAAGIEPLIVVGRRGRGGFAEMLLGSVPHSLSHHANCPVLIVPEARS